MSTLRQLEYLIAVAETGHFRRAAESVHVSQPALSEQLKTLELRLGVTLIERGQAAARLTPIGEEIAKIGRRMLSGNRQIKLLAAMHIREASGMLAVGLIPTIGAQLWTRVLPQIEAVLPDLTLQIAEDCIGELQQGLDGGTHDLIIAPPVEGEDIVCRDMLEDVLHLCVAPDHPFARRRRIASEELKGLEILSLAPRHSLHGLLTEASSKLDFVLRRDCGIVGLATLRDLIAAGFGIGFLPAVYLQGRGASAGLGVVEISDYRLSRRIAMQWKSTHTRRQCFERLATAVGGKVGNCAAV